MVVFINKSHELTVQIRLRLHQATPASVLALQLDSGVRQVSMAIMTGPIVDQLYDIVPTLKSTLDCP
jgi:hypothetical protein